MINEILTMGVIYFITMGLGDVICWCFTEPHAHLWNC